jgi:hypothetical protein
MSIGILTRSILCYCGKMNKEHIPEYDRIIVHDQDIADSRRTPRLLQEESVASLAEDIVAEAEYFLQTRDVDSRERYNTLLEELDTAIAINNDPKARELRSALEKTMSGTRYYEYE